MLRWKKKYNKMKNIPRFVKVKNGPILDTFTKTTKFKNVDNYLVVQYYTRVYYGDGNSELVETQDFVESMSDFINFL